MHNLLEDNIKASPLVMTGDITTDHVLQQSEWARAGRHFRGQSLVPIAVSRAVSISKRMPLLHMPAL